MPLLKHLRGPLVLALTALLAGCNMVVMEPSGDIAAQQARLILISTALMLLIIVPVIILTLVFAWRYREANKSATYKPDWDHSTQLELVIWSAPLLIIIALGAITWISTHTLDPYRPLERLDAQRAIPPETKTMVVEVVALDWKWLFFYPEQGIATVNELVAPVDQPIQFRLTASSVMNAFYVPALAGMIYTMPSMETQLHAIINKAGVYDGFSANYSGEGFSDMRFKFHGVSREQFDSWVKDTKAKGETLDRETYLALERPSQRDPIRYFSSVAPNLYDNILNRCVEPGKMCMKHMMAIDAQGGMGRAGLATTALTTVPKGDEGQPMRTVATDICTTDNPSGQPLALAATR